jgi:myxalamid-type polyketide synthase MxaE and MxaD
VSLVYPEGVDGRGPCRSTPPIGGFPRLMADAAGDITPRGVFHLWGLDAAAPGRATVAEVEAAQVRGCGSVLHLVQALARLAGPSSPRLWIATRGAQPVGPEPAAAVVVGAPVGDGPIDRPGAPGPLGRADRPRSRRGRGRGGHLLGEVTAPDGEDQVAFRRGRRHVAPPGPARSPRRARPAAGPAARGDLSRDGGARCPRPASGPLAGRRGARRLVLVGRRGLPGARAGTACRRRTLPHGAIAGIREIERSGRRSSSPPRRGRPEAVAASSIACAACSPRSGDRPRGGDRLAARDPGRGPRVVPGRPEAEGHGDVGPAPCGRGTAARLLRRLLLAGLVAGGEGVVLRRRQRVPRRLRPPRGRHRPGGPERQLGPLGGRRHGGLGRSFPGASAARHRPDATRPALQALVACSGTGRGRPRWRMSTGPSSGPSAAADGRSRLLDDLAEPPEPVGGRDGRGHLDALPPERRRPWLIGFIRDQVACALKQEPGRIDPDRALNSMGVDSLTAIEIKWAVEDRLGLSLPTSSLVAGPTIAQLADRPWGCSRGPPRAGLGPRPRGRRGTWTSRSRTASSPCARAPARPHERGRQPRRRRADPGRAGPRSPPARLRALVDLQPALRTTFPRVGACPSSACTSGRRSTSGRGRPRRLGEEELDARLEGRGPPAIRPGTRAAVPGPRPTPIGRGSRPPPGNPPHHQRLLVDLGDPPRSGPSD